MMIRVWFLAIAIFSSPTIALAEGQTFGIVAKSLDDANFTDTWRGCNEAAAKNNDKCVLIGEHGPAHARRQIIAIEQAIHDHSLSALAISVTKSDFLAKHLSSLNIPVIAFDSDFNSAYQSARKTFVGMDNKALGRQLGELAKKLYPKGGIVCIMTALYHPNLKERVEALRESLSENKTVTKHLEGENNWYECPRSPLDTSGDVNKGLTQVEYALKNIRPDLVISVGHWPVVEEGLYRQTVEPYKNLLTTGKVKMLVTTSTIVTTKDALLDENLIHGYVYVDFSEIGKETYSVLRKVANGESVEPYYYVPNGERLMPLPKEQ
ncbi:substrate-binding domain-containing protein [Vibrio sp.]|nr:substrate-binding domain-containing protein [Vibrio sp.]